METKTENFLLFDNSIDVFLSHIESLWKTMPEILRVIEKTNKESVKKYVDFLESKCHFDKSTNKYLIEAHNSRLHEILKKTSLNSKIAYTIIKRNFLVSLVSQFDTYIATLMRSVITIKPEIINGSEKQLSYMDLNRFSDIISAREYIIEKEIECSLRDSHTEQFKWFERKLGIELRKDLPIWSTFIEITQRRNLFVHSDGKVSSQYINICQENGIALDESVKVGETLDVDLDYYNKTFTALFEIGFKLNQVLRRKLLPNELKSADSSFLNISYDLILNEQYELAKVLYDFADKYIKKYSSKDIELRIILNRAQTYKWLDQKEKCLDIVKSVDWSACSDLFRMAAHVLKEEYESAVHRMKNIGKDSDVINKSDYFDWPIFREFRKSSEFKNAYKEIYGEAGNLVTG